MQSFEGTHQNDSFLNDVQSGEIDDYDVQGGEMGLSEAETESASECQEQNLDFNESPLHYVSQPIVPPGSSSWSKLHELVTLFNAQIATVEYSYLNHAPYRVLV